MEVGGGKAEFDDVGMKVLNDGQAVQMGTRF